jgi:GTP cyclohydrolase II
MNRPQFPATALPPVDRAAGDLRRGAMVALSSGGRVAALLMSAEYLSDDSLAALSSAGQPPWLAMSARRAEALGLGDGRDLAVIAQAGAGAAHFAALTDPLRDAVTTEGWSRLPTPEWAAAAVGLAKLAGLLPMMLVAPADAAPPDIIEVAAEAVLAYPRNAARSLKRVAEADLPLAGAEHCHVVAFRPADGGAEHLALIIGAPDLSQPVLTRLHSACFTGDLLGSLRCDCGEQLQGAIARLAQEGGGVLLYLAQEGRGIGLVNKLRAYRLQDDGLDTLDANRRLGFEDDERLYLPAVQMLNDLDIAKVRLLTNNPAKVEALGRHGIAVTERVAHVFPANPHNRRYLATKAERSGHLF